MSDKPEVSIYPDPPFNSNRNYAAPIDSEDAAAAFKDTWMLLAHLNYFARIYSASPLFACAFTRLVQRMSAHRRMNKGTHTMRLLPSLTFLLVVLLFSACGPRNASVEPPRSTNTPVPTFTSTPAGSTVSETTGESDTQIQVPPTDTPVPSTPIPPTATPTPRPMIKINNDMNVRQGPGTNFPIIGTASPGQQHPITGKNPAGDWWEINYNDQAGWVYGPLVTATNAEHVRLAAQPTSTPRPRPTQTPRVTSTPISSRRSASVQSLSDWKTKYGAMSVPVYNIDKENINLFRGKYIVITGRIMNQGDWVEIVTGKRVGTAITIEVDGPVTEGGGENFGLAQAVIYQNLELDGRRIALVGQVVRIHEEGIFKVDMPLVIVSEFTLFPQDAQ